ncbi:hypothetical protein [Stratiformator vulcanicus]|uniref:Apolipoprotein A1/A4/E domain protein n=1 Tax=Stratiformator vulcanicus TaxID=2527980 RepID=A0A517R4W3_9PLAN|nr:hypothetical protein [Stratiformator vulcanicus]QDT38925.1 hypothetical protein Pan189_33250 [Stratiformator vulcanicus]
MTFQYLQRAGIFGTLTALAVLVGCQDAGTLSAGGSETVTDIESDSELETNSAESSEETVTFEDVYDQAKKTLGLAGEAAADNRDEYLEKLKARMDEMKAEVAELRERADEKADEVSEDMQESIDEVERQMAATKERLNKLAADGTDAWEKLTGGVSDAIDELGQAVEDAKAEFSDESSE